MASVELKCLLTPEASYAHRRLRDLTNENDSTAIRHSLRLHLVLFRAHAQHNNLLAAKPGKRPFPVPILRPGDTMSLSPEACDAVPLEVTMIIDERSWAAMEELMGAGKFRDESELLSQSHLLRYDLLERTQRGEAFYIRDANTHGMRRVAIFTDDAHDDNGN